MSQQPNINSQTALNIALDYDGCANADIPTFVSMVKLLRSAGHNVFIVTMRYPSECAEVKEHFGQYVNDIIPTSRRAKREACEKLYLRIHIWMDDNPLAVEYSAHDIWGKTTPEGTIHSIDHATNDPVEQHIDINKQ